MGGGSSRFIITNGNMTYYANIPEVKAYLNVSGDLKLANKLKNKGDITFDQWVARTKNGLAKQKIAKQVILKRIQQMGNERRPWARANKRYANRNKALRNKYGIK